MKISKEDVINTLKTISLSGDNQNIIDKGSVSNVMIFGDQIDIDLKLNNPSLQARKKLEVLILKFLVRTHPIANLKGQKVENSIF